MSEIRLLSEDDYQAIKAALALMLDIVTENSSRGIARLFDQQIDAREYVKERQFEANEWAETLRHVAEAEQREPR